MPVHFAKGTASFQNKQHAGLFGKKHSELLIRAASQPILQKKQQAQCVRGTKRKKGRGCAVTDFMYMIHFRV